MQEASLAGIAAISGRAGYAAGDWLLYGKMGWAWGRFSAETITRNAAGTSITQAFGDEYRDGWLVGAGAEYRFHPRMALRLEYYFIDFGSTRNSVTEFGAVTGGLKLFRKDEAQSHIVKVGISHSY
jgi:outer membrane immunogenic protein